MMDFLFPQVSEKIDWSRGYRSEDIEFQKITGDAETGRRYADKLMRVYKKADGEEALIFIHVEVQGQKEEGFSERMFLCNYRIYDRFQKPVISIAILTDENKDWRPSGFGYGIDGARMHLNFPAVKLVDFAGRWKELQDSENIFSLCVMAQLKAMETKKGYERKRWKMYLLRLMSQKGHDREDVFHLLRFIDWVLRLPDGLDKELWEEFNKLEEVKKMPYLSGYEKFLMEKGLKEGLQKGLHEMVLEALEAKFGMEHGALKERITSLKDKAKLKHILRIIIKASDIKEVEQMITEAQSA